MMPLFGIILFGVKLDINEKLKQEAKSVGLTLVGSGKNRNYLLYKFDDCNHEQEIQIGSVRRNSFNCNQCLQNKLVQEAESVGLTLVGNGKNCSYRLYKFNDCNHEQEIVTSLVRRNSFNCNQCGTCSNGFDPSKPAWFYAIHYRTKNKKDFIKYGITNRTIKQRSDEHIRNTDTKKISILQSINFEDGSICRQLEIKCNELKKSIDISNLIEQNDLKSGHTEILPMDCLENINNFIKEILWVE